MARRRAVLGFHLGDLKKIAPAVDSLVGRVQSLGSAVGRLGAQKGGVSAGGGRGVFAGTMKDFATRDEFVGRAGTIGRGLMAGRLGGVLLAAMSVEEFFRNTANLLKGDREFRDIVADQIGFLMPSIVREAGPALLDEIELEFPWLLELIGFSGEITGPSRRTRLGVGSELSRLVQRVRDINSLGLDSALTRDMMSSEAHKYKNREAYLHELDEAAQLGRGR